MHQSKYLINSRTKLLNSLRKINTFVQQPDDQIAKHVENGRYSISYKTEYHKTDASPSIHICMYIVFHIQFLRRTYGLLVIWDYLLRYFILSQLDIVLLQNEVHVPFIWSRLIYLFAQQKFCMHKFEVSVSFLYRKIACGKAQQLKIFTNTTKSVRLVSLTVKLFMYLVVFDLLHPITYGRHLLA